MVASKKAGEPDIETLTEKINVGAGQHPELHTPERYVETVVESIYDAFGRGDRAAFEALITDDFEFTSPYDDHIDRAQFFERCWPNHQKVAQLAVHRVAIAPSGAFVTYEIHFRDGHRAENTEYLELRDGKVCSVEVYFGATHAAPNRATEKDPSSASRDPHARRDPSDETAQLKPILGTWTITGTNAPSAPGTNTTNVEGKETYSMMDGGFFVEGRWMRHFDDGTKHAGVSLIGLEPERGTIMCENFDNLGYAREYRVSIDGNIWTLEGAHERATYRFEPDGQSLVVDWEMSKDGRTWQPLCHLEARRSDT